MKKILFIIRQLGRGGTERRLIDLKNALGNDFEILVFPLNGENVFTEDELDNTSGYLEQGSSAKTGRFINLIKILRKENPDLIHSFELETGFYAQLAMLFLGKKIPMISGHGAGLIESKFTRKLLNKGFLSADLYICNSELGAKAIRQELRSDTPVMVIRNGIDPDRFVNNIEKPSWKGDRPVIGYIGKLDFYKKGDRMIEVAEHLIDHPKKPYFIVIGVGDRYEMAKERLNQKPELHDMVSLEGHVANAAQLANYFDIGVLCSDSEGLPNVLLEYMALGVPSVSTDVGDVSYVLAEEAGIVTDKIEVKDIALAVEKILNDDELSKKISVKAKKRFKEEFHISVMANRYKEVYLKMMS